MIDRTTRLRWRRRYRKGRRQVEDIGQQAEQQLERHLIRRLSRLWEVRRFIIAWILLLALLSGGVVMQTRALSQYYQTLQPIPGGTYTEGILGSFTDANPLYATGTVDSSVARLVFAGLFKYDAKNQLVGDLAQKWSVDGTGKIYTVKLKPNLRWQDGKPLTAADVVFTYKVIQNPDAKSALASSWQGIDVSAPDAGTVKFVLPNALVSFPYSMTNGLIPEHLLSGLPLAQLRSVSFNTTHPVGAGPFKWETIEVSGDTPETREERLALLPNELYVGGMPKLGRFVIRAIHNDKQLITSFRNQELNAAVGLEQVPDNLSKDVQDYNLPLTSEVMVFLKNSQEILSDVRVRQALVKATDVNEVVRSLGYPVISAREPFLHNQAGFTTAVQQFSTNVNEANKLLDDAGWSMGADGVRHKDKHTLSFRLYTESTSEYALVSQILQRQWRAVGVDAQVLLQPGSDLQSSIAFHTYDALLYGISIGPDSDIFAYWHSSQADLRSPNRLNFSEYKSKTADQALEAGRTRSDTALRTVKYKAFLDAWRNDAPAIVLYQPRFLYLTHGSVFGLSANTINTGPDRFSNVENWMIRQAKTTK